MLVLGRRPKTAYDPSAGTLENDEEVVIGADCARVYFTETILFGSHEWNDFGSYYRSDPRDRVTVGIDVVPGTWLTKVSPIPDESFQTHYAAGAQRVLVKLRSDEKLYLDRPEFGKEGVLIVIAKIVHGTQVRLGFAARRDVPIHRLEVFRRLPIPRVEGQPADQSPIAEGQAN